MIKFFIFFISIIFSEPNNQIIDEIVKKMDMNLNSENRVIKSKMIIHGRRTSRTIESKVGLLELIKHLQNIYLLLERKEVKC